MSSERTANGNSPVHAAEHMLLRGAETGAALYALDYAAKGTPIGAEGNVAAQAIRTAGNSVIAAVLWHFVIAPYLVVTGGVFAIPAIATALLFAHVRVFGPIVIGLVSVACIALWIRFALFRWLWRRFIRPLDARLSGRKLDDPALNSQTRFWRHPARYLSEYGRLSNQARASAQANSWKHQGARR